MPVYTPPALNAVNFALTAQTPANIDPYESTLVSYTVPSLSAVNFALSVYTLPVFNKIIFELLNVVSYFGILKRWTGATWTKALLKVYTTSFVTKPTYRWDGSAWKEIDVTG